MLHQKQAEVLSWGRGDLDKTGAAAGEGWELRSASLPWLPASGVADGASQGGGAPTAGADPWRPLHGSLREGFIISMSSRWVPCSPAVISRAVASPLLPSTCRRGGRVVTARVSS